MRVILIVLFFLSSINAHAINYFWCEKEENCVKTYGGCGRYYSTHRRFKELYEAKAHKADRVANCLPPTAKDKEYKFEGEPHCVKQRCRLSLPKKAQEKGKI